jgi:hypothetical protein
MGAVDRRARRRLLSAPATSSCQRRVAAPPRPRWQAAMAGLTRRPRTTAIPESVGVRELPGCRAAGRSSGRLWRVCGCARRSAGSERDLAQDNPVSGGHALEILSANGTRTKGVGAARRLSAPGRALPLRGRSSGARAAASRASGHAGMSSGPPGGVPTEHRWDGCSRAAPSAPGRPGAAPSRRGCSVNPRPSCRGVAKSLQRFHAVARRRGVRPLRGQYPTPRGRSGLPRSGFSSFKGGGRPPRTLSRKSTPLEISPTRTVDATATPRPHAESNVGAPRSLDRPTTNDRRRGLMRQPGLSATVPLVPDSKVSRRCALAPL